MSKEYSEIRKEVQDIILVLANIVSVEEHNYTHILENKYIAIDLLKVEKLIHDLIIEI